jgi:ATPase subunit of ABC transporter with duplicated ATPase domains
MSASVTLSHIAWSTPDGRALFSDLNLRFTAERAGLVGRNGVGKTTLLKLIAGEAQLHSGAISVQGRVAMMRQTVQIDESETIADLFGARDALALLARAERGDASAADIAEADWTLEARITEALARLRLDAAPQAPLTTLSGGQRTRAALAALVFAQPDFLLLDEPTNNLDREGRSAVLELLSSWRAGAIVVSHDRALLEAMDAIVELTSLGATRYGGGWSAYRERKALELTSAEHDLADAEKRLADLGRTAQTSAERKARKDGVGKRKAAKGDAPRIILGMMKNRAEASGGDLARLAELRREEALAEAEAARARVEVLQPFSVRLAPTGLAAQRAVVNLDHISAGYDPARPVLQDISFVLTGPERIAISGPNGSGKTTLLAVIAGELPPFAGLARVVVPFVMLDQRVSALDSSASIRDNFRRLNPDADENACRAALARFLFRADAALQIVSSLSGGQMLRAGLACVLGGQRPPPLLILDEPTNHLDLDAIEAVEAGLAAFDGALIVVSHDEAFLEAISVTRRVELGAAPAKR